MALELVRKALLAGLHPVHAHTCGARARLGRSAQGAPRPQWATQRGALTRSAEQLRDPSAFALRSASLGHSLAASSAPLARPLAPSPSPSPSAAASLLETAQQPPPPSVLPELPSSGPAGSNPMEGSNGTAHAGAPAAEPHMAGTQAAHPGEAHSGATKGPSPERKKARTLEPLAERVPLGVPPDSADAANGCSQEGQGQGQGQGQGAEQPEAMVTSGTSSGPGAAAVVGEVPSLGASGALAAAQGQGSDAVGSAAAVVAPISAEAAATQAGAVLGASGPATAAAAAAVPVTGVPRPVGAGGAPPVPHAAAAWAHFRALGSPLFHVAPMVDQSELPFRLLCRKYGTTAAYTPMLHSRLFAEEPKYRAEFTTCPEDRPLFVQFCANNPETLVRAATLVAHQCDYIDLNFGCPQRIAKKGNYGAFLMDNLPLVKALVEALAAAKLPALVSCKIRVFSDAERTLAYARMIEAAGCSLLAVHGRTREQKDQRAIRADWGIIAQVKAALSIPVLANGNVRTLEDARACLAATGADGVLSAESLLANPALFGGYVLPELRNPKPPSSSGEGAPGQGPVQGLHQNGTGHEGVPTAQGSAHSGAAEAEAGRAPGAPGSEGAGGANGASLQVTSEVEAGAVGASPRETEVKGGASVGNGHPENCNGNGQPGAGSEGALREGPPGVSEVDGELVADPVGLSLEYLDLCVQYPVPMRMVRAHLHRMLGGLFGQHPHVRERLNKEYRLTLPWLRDLVLELDQLRRAGSSH